MGESKLSWLFLVIALLGVGWGAWLKFGNPEEPEEIEWVRLPSGQLVEKESKKPYEGVREIPYSISPNVILWEYTYVGGFRNGPAKEFYPDPLSKPLKSTATYINGLRQGAVTTYYNTGTISSRVNATDDLLDGILTKYSRDGLVTGREVIEKGIRMTVPAIVEDPVLKKDESVVETDEPPNTDEVIEPPMIDETGEPFTGTQTGAYWRSGKKAFERGFKNGYLDGVNNSWAEDGKPEQEGAYVDGKKDGEWKQWNVVGNLITDETFQHGLQVGPSKRFYPDGKIRVETNFVHGAQNGVRTVFRNSGDRLRETTYDHGEQTNLIEWNRDGSVKTELASPMPEGLAISIAASETEIIEDVPLEFSTEEGSQQLMLGFRYRVSTEEPDPGPDAARAFRASLLKDGEAQGLYNFEGVLGGWRYYSWLATLKPDENWSFQFTAQPGESIIEFEGIGEITEEEAETLPAAELDPEPEE